MTVEAAVCKLGFLLGSVDRGDMTLDEARTKLSLSIRGELSAPIPLKNFSFRDGSFINAFVKTMGNFVQSDVDIEKNLKVALFPILFCCIDRNLKVTLFSMFVRIKES